MDTLDYTGHISTTSGPNNMIKRPLESQEQLLYLTLPMLSIILTPSSATSQPLQNCQTLQQFLSPLYMSILFYGHWLYCLSVVSATHCLTGDTTLQILLVKNIIVVHGLFIFVIKDLGDAWGACPESTPARLGCPQLALLLKWATSRRQTCAR
jgi:hypothetical protein